jgi:fluoride exporter
VGKTGTPQNEEVRVEGYLLVLLGSALGGAGRFLCSGFVARHVGETFPWGTMFVNVVGSFIIGFVNSLMTADGEYLMGTPARQFIMVGFCGGYTTFSSFSLQTLNLVRDGEMSTAAANVGGSVLACLTSVSLGHLAAIAINQTKWA